jgi:spore photoproduct lyase
VYFEPKALEEYELARRLKRQFEAADIPVKLTTSHNHVRGIPGDTPRQAYREAKRTLVVGKRRSKEFQTSKPSAEYALPLATGCPGFCEYCYLQTTLGPRPYVRIYVNYDEIFNLADRYIADREPELTRFEGSCTSDPVPVEQFGGGLKKAIEHFAGTEHGRFRFVTKYSEVDSIVGLDHQGHTEARFSLNSDYVAQRFEPGVPPVSDRIQASAEAARAGYPFGYLIAPVLLYPDWKDDYGNLLEEVRAILGSDHKPSFEIISHRYTKAAKRLILERYPNTELPMSDEERRWKWGQFGYGKWLYNKGELEKMHQFFHHRIEKLFPGGTVKYMI